MSTRGRFGDGLAPLAGTPGKALSGWADHNGMTFISIAANAMNIVAIHPKS